jgi:hypothetical protein
MKRKAMLMGMAVMTGMPGWAMAKGVGKAGGDVRPYSAGMQAQEALERVEFDSAPNEKGVTGASPDKAAELLAQVKSMLRSANYGRATQPSTSNQGWKLEMLESSALSYDSSDSSLQQVKPVGVAFRFKF